MEQEKDSKVIKTLLGVMAVLLCFSVLVAGCAQTAPTQDIQSNQQETTDPEDNTDETEVDTQDVEMQREDTQTQEEKNDAQIQQFLEDGVHTQEITYSNPSGADTFELTYTTEGDVITEISLTPVGEPHQVSLGKMEAVDGALPDLVVGKNIADIQLPKNVAGSSLTSGAVQKHFDSITA